MPCHHRTLSCRGLFCIWKVCLMTHTHAYAQQHAREWGGLKCVREENYRERARGKRVGGLQSERERVCVCGAGEIDNLKTNRVCDVIYLNEFQ